ncbi:hypothetical protein [Nocardia lasii]|uniref:Uncharacterized protein n=1 Tax=Nocardia lasii TaxID=1616107 RepID=A0ABW1JNY3_9NOCA
MPNGIDVYDIEQADRRLAAIRGSARAQDGCMGIETDVGGRITDLWFADWAMEQHGQQLAEIIIDRHRAALDSAHAVATREFGGAENE